MTLKIITTGGTIDKIYFDAKSEFHIGDTEIPEFFRIAGVDHAVEIVPLLRKDSLEMTDADRTLVRAHIEADPADRILITHGTDTMVQTGQALAGIPGKTIVLTGAMQPSRLRVSDACFNVAFALGAVQFLPAGVYIAMHGRVFDPLTTRKNVAAHRFEASTAE